MPDLNECSRGYLDLVARQLATPDEILVLAPSNRAADAFTGLLISDLGRERVEAARILTIHGFCSRLLRENAFDAGLDPRFTMLDDARKRVMLARLADAVIESHRAELSSIGFPQDGQEDALRDAVVAMSGLPCGEAGAPNDPRPFLETFHRCCRELISPSGNSQDWPEKRLVHIRDEMARALPCAEKLIASLDGNLDWSAFRKLTRYRARFVQSSGVRGLDHVIQAARIALNGFLSACLDAPSSTSSGLLRRLASVLSDRYAAEKDRLGALDFDDLAPRVNDLLRRCPDVADRYHRELKHVMVAGMDDLAPAEREIVEAISSPGKSGTPRARVLRSHPGIVRFIERFFREVWGEDRLRVPRLESSGRFADDAEPPVEVILLPRSEVRSPEIAARMSRDEARTIAQRILDLTGRLDDKPRFRFRDIVVLAGSGSAIRVYERVFEEHGIPVYARGGSLYDTREILDILSFLKALDDPGNDAALAEVLLSPFAGITQNSLLAMCNHRLPDEYLGLGSAEPSGRLIRSLSAVEDVSGIEEYDRSKLTAFRETLRGLLEMRVLSGVSEILESALRATRFDLRVLAMKGGRRRYANVSAFRDIAREAQADGEGLGEFIVRIEELRKAGARETEPAVEDEDADAVRVMSVRATDGVRAPVVFIAGMSRPVESRPGLAVSDPEIGLSALVVNPFTNRLEASLGYREIADRVREQRISDEKSLLFEAMTHAERKLVLVGASGLAADYGATYRETRSWIGWVEKALNVGPGSPEGDISFDGSRVRLRFRPPKPVKASDFAPETLAIRFARELREGLPIEDFASSAAADRTASDAFERCTGERPTIPPRISRFSVSRILDYLQCPAGYRFLHIIGVPESGGDPREDVEETGFTAADLGHAVHDILSRLDLSRDCAPQLTEMLSGLRDEPLAGEARPLLEKFAGGPWADDIRRSDRLLVESPFELMVSGRVIAGRIDALYRDARGWTVLDYKTGRAEDRDRYQLQVGIYAHAVSALLGEMPARVALVLLSIGEEWVQVTSNGEAASRAAEIVGHVIGQTDAGHFDPKPGKHCDWCPASSLCLKELPPVK